MKKTQTNALKRFLKIAAWCLAGLILLPVGIAACLYWSADMGEPPLTVKVREYALGQSGDSVLCRNSYLRQDSCGLWELYVQGSGEVRGAVQGKLTQELMKYQEDVFINQIRQIIPSDRYLGFLRRLILIFNRNLGESIPLEYREEIVAMSLFCTHEYDAIGSPYERQLNYHAAHDIGHTMQQYMLVGCSSFGVWGSRTNSSGLLIGRNFDFYVGDDFAKNKLLTFAVPDSGYRYVSVGWAGMIGVLSGMNECGLTVTINAAKGAIPTAAATPISILTREILQYAATIEEAYRIAESRQTFVSESILVGSARDGRAAVIEKTPQQTALYLPDGNQVICTNHFQSEALISDAYNVENMADSDSKYRYDRLSELLVESPVLTPLRAVEILRNRLGEGNREVGIGNEMTLNQSIAHHSVVFRPQEQRMWVSTSPWQSGLLVCYNLKDFFSGTALPHRESVLDIPADSVFMERDYPRLLQYRSGVEVLKKAIKTGKELDEIYLAHFRKINPEHYYSHRLSGDYYRAFTKTAQAVEMYRQALKCAIPYQSERTEIENLIKKIENEK